MFVGRKKEMSKLTEAYNNNKFEMAVIYGRRRVGKTKLITEFIKDKEAIYFSALEVSDKINLANLSRSIMSYETGRNVGTFSYGSYADCLDALYEIAKTKKLIFVIDEYPYLAASFRGISSLLQQYIDLKWKETNMLVILCGSSMSFMENQVLGYQSPLYGRRTMQFKIEPLDFWVSRQFHENFTDEEKAVIYGMTGGIPQYLELIDDNKSLKENIIKNFFDNSSYLYDEPTNLLKQELREPALYNSIITAIADGASRINEIANKTGLDNPVCSKYLKSLMDLGIIKREKPAMEKDAKRSIYRLADGMFRFWFRFVAPNVDRINKDQGEIVYRNIEAQISDFMGQVFEEISKQYLWKLNLAGDVDFATAERWWGTNPHHKRQEEIDIIAYDDGKMIFCECKWRNEKVAKSILDNLIEKAEMFYGKEKSYMVFSKSGFTDECLKLQDADEISLISLNDMLRGVS